MAWASGRFTQLMGQLCLKNHDNSSPKPSKAVRFPGFLKGFSRFGGNKKKEQKGFSSTSGQSKSGRNLFLSLFGLPFFAMGLGFCWLGGISPILESREALSWEEVPCKITDSFVESHSSSDGTTYSVEIRYSYEWNERKYDGDQYTFGNMSSSGKASKKEIVSKYPKGSMATCLVNPIDPSDSVITREVGWLPYGIIAFSSIFIAVGAGLIITGLRKKKPSIGGVKATSISQLGQDETFKLKPEAGRIARTIGSVIFAIIWNGFACIPIYIYLQERKKGNPEWFLLLFGVIFGILGLLLIANAVRSLLAMRNPLPEIMVSPGKLMPGSHLNLSWRMQGSVRRLSNLAIYIEAQEIARFQKGTRTVTDKNTFLQVCLFESSHKGDFQRGSVKFQIPEETVPTMKIDHNEITWQIVFVGDVPRWPDLSETYPMVLQPAQVES